MEILKTILLFTSLCIASNASAAWDGVTNGEIDKIDVTAGTNYGFRIILKGAPKLCGNDHN